MDIKEIYDLAKQAGACEDKGLAVIKECLSVEQLIDLLLTPQGIEFCMENSFPSLPVLMLYKDELEARNIFVDGEYKVKARGKVLVFGGDVTVYVDGYNVADIYVTNGASIRLVASDNAYVSVELHSGAAMEFERYGMAQVNKFIK